MARGLKIATILTIGAIFAACGSGTPAPLVPEATISLSGTVVKNGAIELTEGSGPVTLQATQANYSGSYTFSIANSAVATVSAPATALARRGDAVSTVTETQGTVTIAPVSIGSTTLTITTNTTLTVPVTVLAPLTANPATLTFLATGAAAAQTTTVTEANFSGTLSETDTCSGIATVTPPKSTSPYTATVTPVSGGTCTITFTDGTQTAPVAVSVTSSGIIVNAQPRP
jgi:hypothetical protein